MLVSWWPHHGGPQKMNGIKVRIEPIKLHYVHTAECHSHCRFRFTMRAKGHKFWPHLHLWHPEQLQEMLCCLPNRKQKKLYLEFIYFCKSAFWQSRTLLETVWFVGLAWFIFSQELAYLNSALVLSLCPPNGSLSGWAHMSEKKWLYWKVGYEVLLDSMMAVANASTSILQ